jgi:hypothetical protein
MKIGEIKELAELYELGDDTELLISVSPATLDRIKGSHDGWIILALDVDSARNGVIESRSPGEEDGFNYPARAMLIETQVNIGII